ncbi:hypothetical protein [Methylogaea oryzae]|uniref:Uncharacterized protein n=1 Tax=Methylogaea oryzae TaxID=1295382 RepID=A0A8D4VM49_9GAMM|nr:hypothetical protein [Methylogaea oryzae]BBL70383.1 hypothetical protein MoryE10_09890 [Methylogaea oryzae]
MGAIAASGVAPVAGNARSYEVYAVGSAGRWAGAVAAAVGLALLGWCGWPGVAAGLPLAAAGSARWLWREQLTVTDGNYRLRRGWPGRMEQRQGRLADLRWRCATQRDECGFRWFALQLAPTDAGWAALVLGHYASRRQAVAAARRWTGRVGARPAHGSGAQP